MSVTKNSPLALASPKLPVMQTIIRLNGERQATIIGKSFCQRTLSEDGTYSYQGYIHNPADTRAPFRYLDVIRSNLSTADGKRCFIETVGLETGIRVGDYFTTSAPEKVVAYRLSVGLDQRSYYTATNFELIDEAWLPIQKREITFFTADRSIIEELHGLALTYLERVADEEEMLDLCEAEIFSPISCAAHASGVTALN